MIEGGALAIAGCLYILVCWLGYNDEFRKTAYFVPVATAIAALVNLLWFTVLRTLDDRQKIYVFSMCWDAVIVGVYYSIPVLFLGVKLDRYGLIGVFLILCGVCLLKLRH